MKISLLPKALSGSFMTHCKILRLATVAQDHPGTLNTGINLPSEHLPQSASDVLAGSSQISGKSNAKTGDRPAP